MYNLYTLLVQIRNDTTETQSIPPSPNHPLTWVVGVNVHAYQNHQGHHNHTQANFLVFVSSLE